MAFTEEERVKARRAVEALFERYHLIASKRPKDHIDFDSEVMNSVKLLDATPDGKVTYELLIGNNFSNLNNVMHGGAAGLIFDMCTTTALCPLAFPGQWEFLGGVTRTLNVSYLRAVPIGTTVRVFAEVVQAGRTMALLQGRMTSTDGKVVYCTCEHHKVHVPTGQGHLAAKVPWDEEFEKQHAGRGGREGGAKL